MAQDKVERRRDVKSPASVNRSESLFRTLFDASPDGIFIVDSQALSIVILPS